MLRLVWLSLALLLPLSEAIAEDGAIYDPAPPLSKYYVLFDSDSTELDRRAKNVLDEVVRTHAVKPNRAAVLAITGHYDRSASEEYAAHLSQKMAEAVRAYLVTNGVPLEAIRLDWRGEREPLVPTPDGVAEEANRRVDIVFVFEK